MSEIHLGPEGEQTPSEDCSPLSQYPLKCLLSYHMDTNHISAAAGRRARASGGRPGDGTDLLDCSGLADPHAHGKSWQALLPQAHRQEEDADRRRLGVYQEMVE